MLAGSTPADPTVANSYASASQEDQGLTGMVLKLIRKQPLDDAPDTVAPRHSRKKRPRRGPF